MFNLGGQGEVSQGGGQKFVELLQGGVQSKQGLFGGQCQYGGQWQF